MTPVAALPPIPFFSSPQINSGPEVKAAIERVVRSGNYINGPEANAFASEFADYVGAGHCVLTGNGSDALELALRAAGVGSGDRVVTVANAGFYGSAAIRLVGAEPVYADIDPATLTMSARALVLALQHKPRAVIATHLYGQMADITALRDLCTAADVVLIEDCAQAHGALSGGRKAGSWGAIACFSFYPTKNLGALGDAGALVTSDPEIARRLRALRQYGWSDKYTVALPGGRNSRMDELQAAVLRIKLRELDGANQARHRIALRYGEGLRDTPLVLPRMEADHVAHLYVVRSPDRDALRQHLRDCGVHCEVHYPIADHLQPAYAHAGCAVQHLKETEQACTQVLSLPCFPGLGEQDVERVIQAIRQFFQDRG